ncbi:hypothetical protein R3P38DRAFT_787705 [Favolaschia claudopus]|uniref:Uncharacterized protein n=1 Tax=Favolaschia claudopus TaxID=2862362 RepID=A0AAW0C270_9AGAR
MWLSRLIDVDALRPRPCLCARYISIFFPFQFVQLIFARSWISPHSFWLSLPFRGFPVAVTIVWIAIVLSGRILVGGIVMTRVSLVGNVLSTPCVSTGRVLSGWQSEVLKHCALSRSSTLSSS